MFILHALLSNTLSNRLFKDWSELNISLKLLTYFFQLPLTLRFVRRWNLLWTLFKRGDVSSNWNPSLFLSATKYCIFCPEIFF